MSRGGLYVWGMDELIEQGQWWWVFAVPIATGMLAVLGSFLGTRFGKSAEHKQWVRNQKMKSYTEYLDACTAIHQATRGRHTQGPEEAGRSFHTFVSDQTPLVIPKKLLPLLEAQQLAFADFVGFISAGRRPGHEVDETELKRLEQKSYDATAALRDAFKKDLKL